MLSVYGVNEMAEAFDTIEPGAAPGTTRPYWSTSPRTACSTAFVGVLACVSALSFGLLPAWHISKTDPHETLKDTGRSGRAACAPGAGQRCFSRRNSRSR